MFTPPANFAGLYTFPATASFYGTDRAITFIVTVTPVNDPPVANEQNVATDGQAIGILLTGSDVDGDPLDFFTLSSPSHGSLSGVAPNLTYAPDSNFVGTDSFTFKANDGAADSNVATVSIMIVDNVPPTVTGTPDRAPDNNGWYNHAVTATWSGTDSGSGIESCGVPTVYSGPDGGSITLTGECTDNAGNTGTGTVTIKYDATAPTIKGTSNLATSVSGWHRSDMTVHFDASDATSGIQSVTPDIVLTEGAGQTAAGTATDNAGNSATSTLTGINIDKTAPEITITRTPANENGWNNQDVTVNFQATDSLSGVQGDSFFGVFFELEGAGQTTGLVTFTDLAGNIASEEVSDINIDKTVPEVTGSLTDLPNENGWYNSDVTIEFTATDDTSGIDAVTHDTVISSEGEDQSVTGEAVDLAGNSATFTVDGIHIDKTAPELAVPEDIEVFPTSPGGAEVDFEAQATDNLDSSPEVEYSTEPGSTFAIGTRTVDVTATDQAGNHATGSFTITVLAPEEATEGMIEMVEDMDLPGGTENGFTSKLDAALKSLEKGNEKPAQNQLKAFINHVEAQTGKSITEEQAAMLIEAAQDIINSIS